MIRALERVLLGEPMEEDLIRAQQTALTDKLWWPLIDAGTDFPKPFDQTNGAVDFDTDDGDDGSRARTGRIMTAGVIAHGFMRSI